MNVSYDLFAGKEGNKLVLNSLWNLKQRFTSLK